MLVGFLLTNVSHLTDTWTSSHLAVAALQMGHRVRLLEPWGHEVTEGGRIVARAWVFDEPVASRPAMLSALKERRVARRFIELRQLDLLLLRVNPLTPTALQAALLAQEAGVSVVNDPMGTLLTRSKAWLAALRDVPRPATLVTSSLASAEAFQSRYRREPLVVKPTHSSGGRGVALVRAGHARSLRDAFTEAQRIGAGQVVVQRYIAGAEHGEKRIVWVDGQIVGAYLRKRGQGEFRHNLKRGGLPERAALTAGDHEAVARISPHLARHGVRLAGLDLISEQIVEVNTVNPGGLHWSEAHAAQPGTLAARAIALLTHRDRDASSPPLPDDPA